MQTLEPTLRAYDIPLLAVIAARWDVDMASYSVSDVVEELLRAMLNPDAAAATWDRLDDDQRGAMQTLLGAGGVMPAKMFARLFGDIREMGPARLEREKPYLNPASVAEALFYRGLIARGFSEGAAGTQPVIFVPPDLAAVLPAHHTGYDLSAEDEEDLPPDDESDALPADWQVAAGRPDAITQADTSLVDDLTTLLAYAQIASVQPTDDGALPAAHADALGKHLLKHDGARLAFLLNLARALELLAPRDGLLKPVSSRARAWLDAPRSEQVQQLAEGWRTSTLYNELYHLPDLAVEQAANDPRLARAAIADLLADMPHDSWWSVDHLLDETRTGNPDFQRPGGDYDGWYIRDERGHYLRGFESWDAVDGATLRFILTGPLHWLGLADLGAYAGRTIGHLNAYGRAFYAGGKWPAPPEERESLVLHDDGTAEAGRRFSRYERFQLARFTEWLSAGDVYRYRFSPRGFSRATRQGIEAPQVRAFLTRALDDAPLPEKVAALLARWEHTAEADASIERLIVLRMASAEALEAVLNEPGLRRYLGARLGPEAVEVRAGQAAALQDALAEFGVLADLLGVDDDRPA